MHNDINTNLQSIYDQLIHNDKKRLLFIVPESTGDVFLCTSLLPNLKKLYPDYDIYFACYPKYQSILKNNPNITKVIDYNPIMDNQVLMEGTGQWKGLFDISMMVTALTQRMVNYLHNGLTNIMFDLRN
jgi:ADP-heptose:LPS heptosyltransferase